MGWDHFRSPANEFPNLTDHPKSHGIMKWFFYIHIFLISFVIKAQVPTGDMIIRNGTVLTITKGTHEETDILVEKGKITAIGDNLKAPQGIKEIDATGLFVMPGIIDAHSH